MEAEDRAKTNKLAPVQKVLDCLEMEYPEAKTALNFTSHFELLIATILSAQCTDKQVNKITGRLFAKYHRPEDFADLIPKKLEEEIKGCGLYRNKAKNIIAASKKLLSDFEGEVPRTMEQLTSLPGVGRKTANVVLANAFAEPAFAVDTHVFRLAHRLGWSSAKNAEQTEEDLCRLVPREKWARTHHLLIHHGRQICRARNPKCNKCVLSECCPGIGLELEMQSD